VQRKTTNDTSEIRTETNVKDSDSSLRSIHKDQIGRKKILYSEKIDCIYEIIDTITTDASDIERRIRTYHEQLKTKKTELEKLKQRKTKDALRRQEDELKKQLQVTTK
jgi:hypothetical protein